MYSDLARHRSVSVRSACPGSIGTSSDPQWRKPPPSRLAQGSRFAERPNIEKRWCYNFSVRAFCNRHKVASPRNCALSFGVRSKQKNAATSRARAWSFQELAIRMKSVSSSPSFTAMLLSDWPSMQFQCSHCPCSKIVAKIADRSCCTTEEAVL